MTASQQRAVFALRDAAREMDRVMGDLRSAQSYGDVSSILSQLSRVESGARDAKRYVDDAERIVTANWGQ